MQFLATLWGSPAVCSVGRGGCICLHCWGTEILSRRGKYTFILTCELGICELQRPLESQLVGWPPTLPKTKDSFQASRSLEEQYSGARSVGASSTGHSGNLR